MSDQNPFGAPPPVPPPYGAPQQPWGGGAYPPEPPTYPDAGYGVPQQQPWGGGMVPPPRQQSRRALWIGLGCVAGVVLLGAGLLGYFVYDATSKGGGTGTSTTTGTSTSTGTSTTTGGGTSGGGTSGGPAKISLPSDFQGMPRHDENPLAVQLKTSMDGALGASGTTTPISTVYTDGRNVVAVFGGYGEFVGPRAQVDSFFTEFEKGAESKGTTFSDRRDFPAGPRGGRLACEVMHAPTENDSLCVWADDYTLVATLTGKAGGSGSVDLDKAAAAALELRATAEVPE